MKNNLFDFKWVKTKLSELGSQHSLFVYPFSLFVVFFILYTQSFNFGIGDQFFYAIDIETGKAIRWIDQGHPLYRPLGWLFYKFFQTFGYPGRAVTVLQFESAFFGALGVSGFFYLVYNLIKDTKVALFSASILAFSHSYWTYSGNGSAYVPSTCIMIFTFILLFKLSEFSQHQQKTLYILTISLISALSALFWLPQVLSFPAIALGIILIPQHLNYRKRFTIAFTYLLGLLLFLIMPLLLGFIFINGCKSFGDLLFALNSTGGSIPIQLSVFNFLRTFYGVAKAFVAIPDLGATVKGLITGDFNLVETNLILDMSKFLSVWTACLLAVSYLIVKWKVIEKNLKIILLILSVWILPFFCFGIICRLGADLERMLPALPAIILAASITVSHIITLRQPLLARFAKTISLAIFVALIICNFLGFFIPARNITNDKNWKIAKSLGQKMNPNDLVMIWGLDVGGVGKFLFYYAHRQSDNMILSIVHSPTGWDERWVEKIKTIWARGGKVFIHNRLITEKDVPESGWSEKEYPHPNREELRTFFSQYRKTFAWIIEDEIFWEITYK